MPDQRPAVEEGPRRGTCGALPENNRLPEKPSGCPEKTRNSRSCGVGLSPDGLERA